MLLIIIGLFIILIIGFLSFTLADTTRCHTPGSKLNQKLECMLVGLTIPTVIFGIICCGILGCSYFSYLNLHKYRVSFEVRATAISFYSEKGVQEFNTTQGKEITDLKYNQYQHTVGEFIRDLKNTVEEYNRILVAKRQMKATLFWSWLIVAPDDDMQPIVLSTFLKKGN